MTTTVHPEIATRVPDRVTAADLIASERFLARAFPLGGTTVHVDTDELDNQSIGLAGPKFYVIVAREPDKPTWYGMHLSSAELIASGGATAADVVRTMAATLLPAEARHRRLHHAAVHPATGT